MLGLPFMDALGLEQLPGGFTGGGIGGLEGLAAGGENSHAGFPVLGASLPQ